MPETIYTSAGSRAAAELRHRISDGVYLPGTQLAEQQLAADLGISRNTLREAFMLLFGEALLTRIPHRGVFVRSPTAEDIREIYHTRRLIEPAAVLWGELTPELAQRLRAAAEATRQAGEAQDGRGISDAGQEVHRCIASMSGSVMLEELMERTLARTRLVILAVTSTPDLRPHFVDHNTDVVDRLLSGDREGAVAILLEYLDVAEVALTDLVSPTVA